MRIECPNCSAKLQAPEKLLGKTVKCPKCSHPIAVPNARCTEDCEPEVKPPSTEQKPANGWTKQTLTLLGVLTLSIVTAVSISIFVMLYLFAEPSDESTAPATASGGQSPENAAPISFKHKLNFGDEFNYRFSLTSGSDGEQRKHSGNLTYQVQFRPTVATIRQNEFLPSREHGNGIVLPDGKIITSLELVQEAAELSVVVNGITYPATVIKTNKLSKIVILQIYSETEFGKPIADAEEDLIVHPRPEKSNGQPWGEWIVMFRDMKDQLIVFNNINGGFDRRLPPTSMVRSSFAPVGKSPDSSISNLSQ